MPLSRLPRLAVVAAAGALVVTACTTDEVDDPTPAGTDTASPTATDTSTPSPTTPSPTDTSTPSPTAGGPETSSPSPTGTAADVPALSGLCQLESTEVDIERVEFAVPEGWQVEDGNCEFFDPALDELEPATEPDNAVSVRIADTDYSMVADPDGIAVESRHVGARSGYQAVRVSGESTGEGLRPEGSPILLWVVDLDAGTDEQGGTLVVSARSSSGADFDLAAQAADRMAETLRITPTAVDEGAPIAVTRTEGGGTPWTVTFDPAEGCFHLRPGGPTDDPADEACDVEAGRDTVDGAILSDGDLEVVAGLAPPLAARVDSDAADGPRGGVTTSLEGASAFAYDATTTPLDVRAVDVAGRTLATGTVG